MGEWLGTLAPWDHFSTYTFARPVTVNGAMHQVRRHFSALQKRAGLPLYGYVGAERGDRGGLIHLHALLGNTAALTPWCGERLRPGWWGKSCCMVHSWPCGIARVYDYDPTLGAKHYVCKYVVKQLAEWELFGFPARPQGTIGKSVLENDRTAHHSSDRRSATKKPVVLDARGVPLSARMIRLLKSSEQMGLDLSSV